MLELQIRCVLERIWFLNEIVQSLYTPIQVVIRYIFYNQQ